MRKCKCKDRCRLEDEAVQSMGDGVEHETGKQTSRVIEIQSGSSGHDGWSGPTPNSGNLGLCE